VALVVGINVNLYRGARLVAMAPSSAALATAQGAAMTMGYTDRLRPLSPGSGRFDRSVTSLADRVVPLPFKAALPPGPGPVVDMDGPTQSDPAVLAW
jgi:hypothetical protein